MQYKMIKWKQFTLDSEKYIVSHHYLRHATGHYKNIQLYVKI